MKVVKLHFFIPAEISVQLLIVRSGVEIAPIKAFGKPWPTFLEPLVAIATRF